MTAEPARLDFLGIGVMKAATSWLFACLQAHPEICSATPGEKELNFFNHHWELGYSWLHSQFKFGAGKCGEYSPRYFHSADVPQRIANYRSDIKLLLAVRDPVARAVSQHLHEARRARLPKGTSFREALRQNPSYLEQGRYATHLERWYQHFPEDQLLVLLHDDIRADPDEVLRRAFSFLGVDSGFRPREAGEEINPAVAYRSPRLAKVAGRSSTAVRRVLGDRVLDAMVRTRLPAAIRKVNTTPPLHQISDVLDADTEAWLREQFADENERLAKLINRDLSAWK